jgi:hypothetical protein
LFISWINCSRRFLKVCDLTIWTDYKIVTSEWFNYDFSPRYSFLPLMACRSYGHDLPMILKPTVSHMTDACYVRLSTHGHPLDRMTVEISHSDQMIVEIMVFLSS